jgi:hypothetical protein
MASRSSSSVHGFFVKENQALFACYLSICLMTCINLAQHINPTFTTAHVPTPLLHSSDHTSTSTTLYHHNRLSGVTVYTHAIITSLCLQNKTTVRIPPCIVLNLLYSSLNVRHLGDFDQGWEGEFFQEPWLWFFLLVWRWRCGKGVVDVVLIQRTCGISTRQVLVPGT